MVTRTFDILDQYKEEYRIDDALACKVAGKWVKYSGDDYIDNVNNVSCGLLSMGYVPGDRIAMIANNRPEWNFLEMGMAQIGVVSVPLYPTISVDEYQYILTNAAVRMVVVSDKLILEKLRPLFEKSRSIEHVYSFNSIEGVCNWKDIVVKGQYLSSELLPKVQKIKDSVMPDDMVTLIYTSGTTGAPKGVMLSHNNLVSNVRATCNRNYLHIGARAISFLPLNHIYERMMNYHFQNLGIAVYYAENTGSVLDNIREVKPHIFTAVPQMLERIYLGIIAKGTELKGIKRKIFNNAIEVAVRYSSCHEKGILYRMRLMIARRLIFSKWTAIIGGQVRIIVSAGVSLRAGLVNLFNAIGIDLLEGYGLTETSPAIAVSDLRRGRPRQGTAGTILEELDVKLTDEGEILCKGPNVMLGYFKNPELTAQVIDDEGYFHTGDTGTLDKDGFLTVIDRKNEIFTLSSGEYVSPQMLENRLREIQLIERVIVIGENEKFISALISPDFAQLHKWCYKHEIKFSNDNELVQLPEVNAYFQKEINRINRKMDDCNRQIRRFRIVADEWSVQTGELSPTLKLKRQQLIAKYTQIIDEIYDR